MSVRHWLTLATILAVTAAVYLAAGLAGAYLAADDFQWLGGGHTFTWARLQYVTGGDRFYRPAADLWFATTTSVCGYGLPCHHAALLGVHLANIALVFVLGTWLFGDLRTVLLGTLLFALQPAYTQAVVWLSAITGVLCAFGYLGSLTAIVSSWRTGVERQRRRQEGAAVALFALASFSHEAAVTLPLVAAVMWWLFGPSGWASRRILTGGAAAVVAAFAAATLLANRRNALFGESGYGIGVHAIDHALDYVASLYVGPSSTVAHVFIVAAVVLFVLINRTTRFGAAWLIVTMLPYLPFVTGNTSRYAYLPAIGFAWAVGGAIVAAVDRLKSDRPGRGWAPALAYTIATLFVVVRFAPFAYQSVRGHVQAFEDWRTRARQIADSAEERDGTIRVPDPGNPVVDRMYIEPIVQWERRDYRTPVTVVK